MRQGWAGRLERQKHKPFAKAAQSSKCVVLMTDNGWKSACGCASKKPYNEWLMVAMGTYLSPMGMLGFCARVNFAKCESESDTTELCLFKENLG